MCFAVKTCTTSKQCNSASKEDSTKDAIPPVLPVPPGFSRSLLGLSRPRDFIGGLPTELSKRILGTFTSAEGTLTCNVF